MTIDVSGFGTEVQIRASNTFPAGFTIDQFSDDADPIDSPSVQIADVAMGVNGDLIVWAKGAPIPVTINVIPNGDDDINLGILTEANRAARGKVSAKDTITLTIIFPNGGTVTCINGRLTDAMILDSIGSSSRKKTKPYTFKFENIRRTQA